MENKFLKQKMLNLVAISTKDKAVFTKLNSNEIINPISFFDKYDLDRLFENGKSIKIDESKWNKVFDSIAKECKSFSSFKKKIEEYNLFVPAIRMNSLKTNFSSQNKIKAIEYLKNKYSNIEKTLTKIDLISKAKKYNTGEWFFYIAKYFLVGKIPNSQDVVKAPLIFRPIKYNKKENTLSLYNDEILINEKIMVQFIKTFNKNSLKLQEWNGIKNLEDAKEFFKEKFNLDIKHSDEFMEFKNEDMPNVRSRINDGLKIENTYIMGLIVPTGGNLKKDLLQIIQKDIDIFDDFVEKNKIDINNILFDSNRKIHQISPLNLSQLSALYYSMESNTIIHGPPGTGKSETISNIIANVLLSNKSALMVSEKKAALDVLIDRLGNLKDFGIFFQESKLSDDKKKFYGSIRKLESIYLDYKNKKRDKSDFNYPLQIVKNDYKTRNFIKEFFELNEEIKQMNFEGFDYFDYLKSKNKIDKNIYETLVKFNLQNINRKDYYAIKGLSSFLEKNNLQLSDYINFYSTMKLKIIKFYDELDKINNLWSKFNIKSIPAHELKEIEESQPNIKEIFEANESLKEMLSLNIYHFDDQEKKLKILFEYCNEIELNNFWLNEILKSYVFIRDLKKKKISLTKKKMISLWGEYICKINGIHYKNFDDKKIYLLTKKFKELNFEITLEFSTYLSFEHILQPINLFFYFNNFVFEKWVTTFIENDWLKLNKFAPQLFKEFNITLDMISICYKRYNFKKNILTSENIQKIKKFYTLEEENKITQEKNWNKINDEIYALLSQKMYLNIENSELKDEIIEMFRISNLKRLPRIRAFIRDHFDAFKLLFPIWITKPDEAADIIDNEAEIFDYGIFDEASQMFLERACPILYRTKIKIVAGDEKQLKPSSFFSSRIDEELEDDDIYELDFNDTESLLSRVVLSEWNEILLNNHYRSISQDLIEFSNKFIYDSKLNIATYNKKLNYSPIKIIDINGFFEDGINKEEAKEVINQVEKNIDIFHKILIITFNMSQSFYISKLLEKSKNKNVRLRFKENNLVVTNLENVQGNEGDLTIISISYAKSPKTYKLRKSFGPLNMNGGKNRLNVVLTRAKAKMIIIKSFYAKELPEKMNNENGQCFRDFINFCDQYNENKEKNELRSNVFETKFSENVYDDINNLIINSNYYIKNKYVIGSTYFDIAILDSEKVKIGIIIDFWKEEDKENKNFLEKQDIIEFVHSRNYKTIIIDEVKYFSNKNFYLNKIKEMLKEN